MAKRESSPEFTQHTRFVEAARELETNDDPATFESLFEHLIASIVPEPAGAPDVSDRARVPEQTIAKEALRLLAQAPGGFMTTSDLIAALERQFEPVGDDAEILEGRSDTRFSQKVRNLVSHRAGGAGLEANGYAAYERARRGFTITDEGRRHAQA